MGDSRNDQCGITCDYYGSSAVFIGFKDRCSGTAQPGPCRRRGEGTVGQRLAVPRRQNDCDGEDRRFRFRICILHADCHGQGSVFIRVPEYAIAFRADHCYDGHTAVVFRNCDPVSDF